MENGEGGAGCSSRQPVGHGSASRRSLSRPLGDSSCCGAQNSLFAYAHRILTAATRSPRCLCPQQRSARSPLYTREPLARRGTGDEGRGSGRPHRAAPTGLTEVPCRSGRAGGDGAPPLHGDRKFLRGPMGASAPTGCGGRGVGDAAPYGGAAGGGVWSPRPTEVGLAAGCGCPALRRGHRGGVRGDGIFGRLAGAGRGSRRSGRLSRRPGRRAYPYWRR